MRFHKLATILLTIALLCSMLKLTIPPTVKANPSTIHVPSDYSMINWAIGNASSGDTILVAAGTYNEELVIDKSLTIAGAGAETTTIDGTGLAPNTLVTITAAGDVTLTNFTIRNAPLLGDGTRISLFARSTVAGPTYTISHNKFYGMNNPDEYDYGFYARGKENIVFTYNLVTGFGNNGMLLEQHTGSTEISHNALDAGSWGIDPIFFMTYDGVDVTTLQNVSYNTFDMGTGGPFDYDHHATGVSFCSVYPYYGTTSPAKFTNMVISGNTFSNLQSNRRAIGFWIGGTGNDLVSPTITGNTITGVGNPADSSGIDFVGSGDVSGATITGNTITGTAAGIILRSGDASGATINYNNIAGNTMGLDWTGGSLADARFNWWGSAAGPSPPGYGDPVTGNADISPWLISPFEQERLYTSPNPVGKAYGDINTDFTLGVNVANIVDLFGFDIKLTWDNSLITFVGVDYASEFNAIWGSGSWSVWNSTNGVSAGMGYYRLVVVAQVPATGWTGDHTLFTLTFHAVRGSNIATLQTPIHFEIAKLSNSIPMPIPTTIEDGLYQMSANTPGLIFQLINNINPSKPFEYGKSFRVQVRATGVSSQLTGYSITVVYDTELLALTAVEWNGTVLGAGTYTESPTGTVNIVKTGGTGYVGSNGLLFTLCFHIQFDDIITHIWRTHAPHDLTRNISFFDAQLTFNDGTLSMSWISIGSALQVTVHLIQGDVDCNGVVDIWDLRTVAAYYDKSTPAKYDLTMDGTIDIFDLVVVATNFNYGM